jgi:hypothetical protein
VRLLRWAKVLSLVTASGGPMPGLRCARSPAPAQGARIAALVGVLLDVGAAGVVVDHAGQIEVATEHPSAPALTFLLPFNFHACSRALRMPYTGQRPEQATAHSVAGSLDEH